MKWWMNAGLQYALAHIPGGQKIHRHLQETRGGLAHLEKSTRFENAIDILELASQFSGPIPGQRAVELGTGWIPATPLTFALAGAKVDSYDVQQLISNSLFQKTARLLEEQLEKISELSQKSLLEICARHEEIKCSASFKEAMEKLDGRFVVTPRTDMLPYKENEVDLVFSNLVLQCIPDQILCAVVKESYRILKPGGIAIHRIRMTDEYAPCDPDRNELLYLAYSNATWNRFFNHALKHVNRWRRPQFMDLFEETGFEIIHSSSTVENEEIEDLKRSGVAKEFQKFSWHEIATVGMHLVLQKPGTVLDMKRLERDDSKQTTKSTVRSVEFDSQSKQ